VFSVKGGKFDTGHFAGRQLKAGNIILVLIALPLQPYFRGIENTVISPFVRPVLHRKLHSIIFDAIKLPVAPAASSYNFR
jgi:hypothetical protein